MEKFRIVNGGKAIGSPGRSAQGEHQVEMLSQKNIRLRASAIHFAAKALGETCSIADDEVKQNDLVQRFIHADRTGKGIVDEGARATAKAYAIKLPPPPSAA